jgi:F-type H+-transporting ATPase subunit epsilon
MATLQLTIVTAERTLLSEDGVTFVSAQGAKGRLGILPEHTPLLSTLDPGDFYYRRGHEEIHVAISGGFLQVDENRVVVLADTAERADEIDEARAEAARRRAEEILLKRDLLSREELVQAEASLRKAAARLKVARYRRQRSGVPMPRGDGEGTGAI